MKRFPLTPLKKEPLKKEIFVWDLETKTDVDGYMHPFLLGYMYRGNYVPFKGPNCVSDFIDYLFSNPVHGFGETVWAHNGGGFDHQFLLCELAKRSDFHVDVVLSGSSTILLLVNQRSTLKSIVFMDSMRLFPTSLKKLANSLWPQGGIHKGEIDLTNEPDDSPKWTEYNCTDCIILYKALEHVQDALNSMGGEMKLTGGACAVDLFRRRYLDRDLWATSYESHEKLFRDSMFGGRTEIFDMRRTENAKTYDINSLYPYACTFPLPTKMRRYYRGNTSEAHRALQECLKTPDLIGFVRGKVYVPNVHLPPLPLKRDKLIFPVGTFSGAWCSPDIENLQLAGGKVTRIDELIVYDAEPIASDMMQSLFRARHTADQSAQGRALVAGGKLVANSWFGKTLQRPEREKNILQPPQLWLDAERRKGDNWEPHDEKGVLWKLQTRKHQAHMLPHIGSAITAIARRRHYADLFPLGEKALYCDTDSIITTADLKQSPDLGAWKLEQQWEWFQAYLPKLYHGSVGGKILTKAKGFGGWNKSDYPGGIVAHLVSGGSVRVAGPAKFKTLVASGNLTPRERAVSKRIRSIYDKRVVNEDGTTTPHRLDE